MELDDLKQRIYNHLEKVLSSENVAGIDHVARMTTWCERLAMDKNVDKLALVAGALLHDIGVVIDRKIHYSAGLTEAGKILREIGFPEDKIEKAIHVIEAHSRYGGPDPQTVEAKIAQDADALEYIGAIGIIRAVVRGIKDGTFSGRVSDFPAYLRSIFAKVEKTFHTTEAENVGNARIKFMKDFISIVEKELNFEA